MYDRRTHVRKKILALTASYVVVPNAKRTAAYTTKKEKLSLLVSKYWSLSLKGAIKSQNMFMLSYVTLISRFYDAYPLIQSNIIFSEFKFSFYSPGQPLLENHISGKEN